MGEGVEEYGHSKDDPENVLVRVDPRYFRPTEVELLLVRDFSFYMKLFTNAYYPVHMLSCAGVGGCHFPFREFQKPLRKGCFTDIAARAAVKRKMLALVHQHPGVTCEMERFCASTGFMAARILARLFYMCIWFYPPQISLGSAPMRNARA